MENEEDIRICKSLYVSKKKEIIDILNIKLNKKINIFIVTDDINMFKMFHDYINNNFDDIYVLDYFNEDEVEILKKIKLLQADVILFLSSLNSHKLLQKLNAWENNILVLILSSYFDCVNIKDIYNNIFGCCLPKPFKIDYIIFSIKIYFLYNSIFRQ